MFEIIRDAAKVGLGALSLSKENLQLFTEQLAEFGKVSKEEGDRLFADLDQAREEQLAMIKQTAEKVTREVVDQMGYAPKVEMEELQKRIATLEALLKEQKPQGETDV
jgi:polyhydroxyalkanoate synthesis regulator phasin